MTNRIGMWVGAVSGGLLVSLACWGGQKSGQTAPDGMASPPRGWTTHSDPLGFSVQTPQNWKVAADRGSGRVNLDGPQGEHVIVWPRWIAGGLDPRASGAVLQKLTASAAPPLGTAPVWSQPQALGPSAVRMLGHAGRDAAVSVLSWIPSTKGTAAYLYVLTAPEATFRQDQATFAQILGSFRLIGSPSPSSGQSSPAVSYVRWQDPRENAFSFEVPIQWPTTGGLFRFAPVDIRPAWQTNSPDSQVLISGGDAQIPVFTIPNQLLAMGGLGEGSWYNPGYGVRMLVRRYVPGAAFAREYVTSRFGRECPGLQITGTRERADAENAINAIYRQYSTLGTSVQLTAGDVTFGCSKGGQAAQGYYFAGTQVVQVAGTPGGMWNVQYLYGYLASSAKAELAQTVLEHILASVQINPQWMAMQQGVAANTSRIVTETQQKISNIIDSTFANRQASLDEISRRRENAILGEVDVIDPETGRNIKVENSSNYYWIDQHGTIVGTQTDTRPNLDFRQLTQLP